MTLHLLKNIKLKCKPTHCKNIFTKFKPNHIQKKGYLSQFACEDCITFGFEHSAVMKTLQESHYCGDHTRCPNWVAPMGPQCSCDDCSSCVIPKLQELPLEFLLHQLYCDDDRDSVLWLECSK